MKNKFEEFIFQPDTRDPSLAIEESEIQRRALNGEKGNTLNGPWKELIKEEDGIKIYRVNSEWIRTNLYPGWNHGGHGYVCDFIPGDEIWVGDTHPANCLCLGVNDERQISPRYFASCVLHEKTEHELMAKGMVYWQAHQLALEVEKEAGFLSDGYTEDYRPLPSVL